MSKNNNNNNNRVDKTSTTFPSDQIINTSEKVQAHDSFEGERQLFNDSIDETKKNIQTAMNESRKQIPRYTQTLNNFQEQYVQATEDIYENYLEYQRQAINSFQSLLEPYFVNMNRKYNNNNNRGLSQEYSKLTNNFAETLIRSNHIFNNMVSSNMDMLTAWISNSKEQSKSIMELGRRNLEVYDNLNSGSTSR
jgi:hypothetical protein